MANTLSAVLNSPAPLLFPVSIPAIIAGFYFQFSLGTVSVQTDGFDMIVNTHNIITLNPPPSFFLLL